MKNAVVVPIRNQNLFVKKTLGASLDMASKIDSYLQVLGDFEHFDIEQVVESASGGRWFDMSSYRFKTDFQRSVEFLEQTSKYNYEGWIRDYVLSLEMTLKAAVVAGDVASRLTPQTISRALEDTGLTWDAEYEEGLPPKAVSVLIKYAATLDKFIKLISIQLARYGALRDPKPKVKKVEVLYHASINAKGLATKGFSLTVPSENEALGLGGSQSLKSGKKGISMTHDLAGALNIAKTFKELAMVANNQLTARAILGLIQREGDPKNFLRVLSFRSYTHQFGFEGGHFVAWKNIWKPGATRPERDFLNPDSLFDTLEKRANLYRAYLQTTPNRKDPFFMHIAATAKKLKGKNPRNIGVVAVEVDMSNEDILYLAGEREFRVPPEAVIRVKKFIG